MADPFQAILGTWTKDPAVFKIYPHQLIPFVSASVRAFSSSSAGSVSVRASKYHCAELKPVGVKRLLLISRGLPGHGMAVSPMRKQGYSDPNVSGIFVGE